MGRKCRVINLAAYSFRDTLFSALQQYLIPAAYIFFKKMFFNKNVFLKDVGF